MFITMSAIIILKVVLMVIILTAFNVIQVMFFSQMVHASKRASHFAVYTTKLNA